jgi:Protein of unknown function (DUF2510)
VTAGGRMSETPNVATPTLPPAGWYEDPMDTALERWWTGADWTDHLVDPLTGAVPGAVASEVAPAVEHAVEPAAEPARATTAAIGGQLHAPAEPEAETYAPNAPAERPYVPMASYDTAAWTQPASSEHVHRGSPNTPAIWLMACSPVIFLVLELILFAAVPSLLNGPTWVISIGALVLLFIAATWDHATLKNRGLPAASFFWMFLTILGYFIARRVTLKRVGVRSNAPGNVLVLLAIGLAVGEALFISSVVGGSRDIHAIQTLETQIAQELKTETSRDWTVVCPADAPASTVNATFTCKATETANGTVIEFLAKVETPDRFSVTVKPAGADSAT